MAPVGARRENSRPGSAIGEPHGGRLGDLAARDASCRRLRTSAVPVTVATTTSRSVKRPLSFQRNTPVRPLSRRGCARCRSGSAEKRPSRTRTIGVVADVGRPTPRRARRRWQRPSKPMPPRLSGAVARVGLDRHPLRARELDRRRSAGRRRAAAPARPRSRRRQPRGRTATARTSGATEGHRATVSRLARTRTLVYC